MENIYKNSIKIVSSIKYIVSSIKYIVSSSREDEGLNCGSAYSNSG